VKHNKNWNDIIIGENGDRGKTATPVQGTYKTGLEILGNEKAYWITVRTLCDIGMTVFKKTEEGRRITRFVKEERWNAVARFIEDTVLRNAGAEDLREIIETKVALAFEKGRETAKKQMRIVLGIGE
jgi:hypothetical protein